jgi:PKD repeat protein
MRKCTILLTVLLIAGTFCYSQNIKKAPAKKFTKDQIDTRVDNMGYWMEKAKMGLVPYNQPIPVPPAEYKGNQINVKGVKSVLSTDVPVTNLTNVTESENSVFVDPNNANYLLNSNNSTSWSGGSVGTLYGANYFQSADGGTTWGGSYQGAGGANSGDPTTAIGLNGREYVNFISNAYGQGIAYSDNGTTWSTATVAPNPGSMADKNHMWIDNSPTSPYEGNLYVAWTDFGGVNDADIVTARSSNDGVTWSGLQNLSSAVAAGSHNQGVNIQTGPNGEVYICWAIYDGWPTDETAIGFAKSTNGGVSYTAGTRIKTGLKGIRTSGSGGKNHRVNSFPSMAVDISGGANNGNLYIVWTNIGTPGVNTGTNRSVYMIRSTNGGTTWSAAIKVNQNAFVDGKSAYFPWISCDPETGVLSTVFYDDRNVTSTQNEIFSAYSLDAGTTWTDFKVGDFAFTPTPISGLASSYMGDYLGITSKGGKVYPCWTEYRGGLFMTYVSPYELGLNASFTASATTICTGSTVTFDDVSTGSPTSWSWSFPGGTPSSYVGQNPPAIAYNSPGTYDVSLTVGDGAAFDTETKVGYISVQNIIANFSGAPTTVVVGNTVTFTDLSSCSPTTWSWTFTGGTPASYSGQTPPAITYNTVGTYDVSLIVTKPGSNDTETKTGYITVIPPEFNMTNGTVTTCTGNFYDSGGPTGNYVDNENYTMTFYPSTTGSMIRFAFSSFISESSYDYLYIYNGENTSAPLIGTYNGTTGPGTVTASNAAGALTFLWTSDVSVVYAGWAASITCYSTTVPPVADFTASSITPPILSTVTFTDASANFPTSWSWSFNPSTITFTNGTSSTSQNPQVIFNDLGLYDVSLTSTNAYGSDNETKNDYINVVNCSYCTAGATTGNEEWIGNVTFNTINNSSAAGTGYTNYTAISTDVLPGNSYPVSVTCGSIGTWTEHIWVFIDFNQDCDFTDAGESTDLGQVSGPGTLSGSITVPAGALPGSTRLRAMLKYNGDPTSCEAYSYGETEDYTVHIPGANLSVDITAFLEGPFVGTSMVQGLVGYVPLNQPYNVAPWNYTGTESVVSIPANAIDWVLIELRDAASAGVATSGTRIGRQAAFLRNDGRVIGLTGTPVLDFGAISFTSNLFAVVHHRNHLSVISSVGLTQTGGIYTYNFSTGSGQAFGGTTAHKQVGSGIWGLFAGDGNKNGLVETTDESPTWETTAGSRGYLGSDYNLDSQSNNLDKDNIWVPNLGSGSQVPN